MSGFSGEVIFKTEEDREGFRVSFAVYKAFGLDRFKPVDSIHGIALRYENMDEINLQNMAEIARKCNAIVVVL